jgi:hypothetical protein
MISIITILGLLYFILFSALGRVIISFFLIALGTLIVPLYYVLFILAKS